ncbi:MAG TPA: hypothetical protein VNQ79_15385 [Blastocatellia bacterium]|nr:hypothetical protein [Blastocatellia bacterium]
MNQNDRFEKTAACPDNELLLAYRRGEAVSSEAAEIERHLRGCEFCLLTLELLTFYPPDPLIPPDPPPVPKNLIGKLRRLRVGNNPESE